MRHLLVFLAFLVITSLAAQRAEFGIGLSVGHSNLRTGDPEANTVFSGVSTDSGPGFALSILASLPITGRLYLTTTPSILFQDQQAVFTYSGDRATDREEIQAAAVVLPLKAELRSQKGKFRPVVSAGIGVIVDLTQSETSNLETESITSFWEITAGVEIPINFSKQNRSITVRPEIFTRNGTGRTVRGVGESIYNQVLGDADWNYVGLRILFYGKGEG
jgi:hypothetical protein